MLAEEVVHAVDWFIKPFYDVGVKNYLYNQEKLVINFHFLVVTCKNNHDLKTKGK